ncbi:hypothetical protein MHBO_003752 [Bonamia ostreae]|uniref:Isoprenylcysteine carboxylmethyltransferase family protein n=1 Tax=Bonamia ostreae TaxID=126728 RepID=A0ABV2ARE5_9EUKA
MNWAIVYCFTVSTKMINWSIIGFVTYTILFQFSTRLTEEITSSKYEEYEDYRNSTNMFLPTFGKIKSKIN